RGRGPPEGPARRMNTRLSPPGRERRTLLVSSLVAGGRTAPTPDVRPRAQVSPEARPPRPPCESIETRLAYLRWLGAMSDRLRRRNADHVSRIEFLQTLWYEALRARLEPAL